VRILKLGGSLNGSSVMRSVMSPNGKSNDLDVKWHISGHVIPSEVGGV